MDDAWRDPYETNNGEIHIPMDPKVIVDQCRSYESNV